MSYNNYSNSNQYSPYFQPTAGHDGRGQYTDESRNTGTYQNNPHQPLSYQTSQQQQSSAPPSASQGYGNGNGAGVSRSQDSRTGYTTDGRPDTTALGNLAYASTLGRDNGLTQQNMYNRTQNYGSTGSYGVNSVTPAPYVGGHQRADSRGSTVTSREDPGGRSQTASAAVTGYQRQQGNTGSNWQAQAQYIAAQRPPTEQSRLSQYSSQSPLQTSGQSTLPTSGQAVQRLGQVVPSPPIPASQAASQRRGNNSRSLEQNRVQSPQLQINRSTGTPTGFRTGNTAANVQQATGHSSTQHSPQIAAFSQTTQASLRASAAADSPANGSASQSSTPTVSEYPTTVDPSQIFNHVEYQRRQAAAAAEQEAARNKAAEVARAAAQPKPNPLNNPQPWKENGSNKSSQQTGIPSTAADPDTAKKNQMELEMKQMIEKMRDYKSKDPSLFSQIWEQVKKGQPPQRNPSALAAQGSPSPVVINGQFSIPNPAHVQLPPESELPAAEEGFPPGFDRGRYPAQRRRRGGKDYTPPRKDRGSHHKKVQAPTSVSTSIPDGYVAAESTPNPGSRTIQQATAEFNGNSGSPIPQTKPQNLPITTSSTPTPPANGQSQVQPPKAGGTYWPENKKQALAEAAQNALTSSNKEKQINTAEIHELLNQNPSYTQMCEILEYRGFRIDRSQFARSLLKAVPDMGPSSAPPPLPPPSSQISTQVSAPQPPQYSVQANASGYVTPYAHPSAPGPPQPQQNQSSIPPPIHGPMGPPSTGAVNAALPSRVMKPDAEEKMNGVKWADQRNLNSDLPKLYQPSTKEQLAKKRTFADIVDLTALSDDEILEPPSQQPRLENDPPVPPTPAASTEMLSNTDHALERLFDTITHLGLRSDTVTPTAPPAGEHKSFSRELLQRQDIVRPMNKRQDAIRRSSYSARTTAQDILISMGKHPTMRPLNAHLDNLRERFPAVDYNSDLSTFRWDLVDPAGPALTEATRRPNDEENIEVTRKRGRPSRGKPLLGGPAASAVHSRPDRSEISGQKHMPLPLNSASAPSHLGHDFARFVRNYIPSMHTPFIGTVPNSLPSHPRTPIPSAPTISTPASSEVQKRKHGRPPGAKNKTPRPDKGIPRKSNDTPSKSSGGTPVRTPDGRNTPMPARPRVDTTPARPSSLRNAMSPGSSAGFAVIIPSRSPSVASTPHAGSYAGSHTGSAQQAMRGRPKELPVAVSDRHPSQPEYKIYKCEWETCPAELHNLETLKKHVRKHRTTYRKGPFPCLWANCSKPEADSSKKRENLVFQTAAEWDEHMGKKHVNAVAWELGDGPATYSSGTF